MWVYTDPYAQKYGQENPYFRIFYVVFVLILFPQAVHDNSDQYYKLEALTARVISPFLGSKGLHIRSEVNKEYHENKSIADRYSNISTSDLGSSENSPEVSRKTCFVLILCFY